MDCARDSKHRRWSIPSRAIRLGHWLKIAALYLGLAAPGHSQTNPPALASAPVLRRLDELSNSIPPSNFKSKLKELGKLAKANRKKIFSNRELMEARGSKALPGLNTPSPYPGALASTSPDEAGGAPDSGRYTPEWSKAQAIAFTDDECFRTSTEGELTKDPEIWLSVTSAKDCSFHPGFKETLAAVTLAHELIHTVQSKEPGAPTAPGECEAACFEKRFVLEILASSAVAGAERHCLQSWCVVVECRMVIHCPAGSTTGCSSFGWNS